MKKATLRFFEILDSLNLRPTVYQTARRRMLKMVNVKPEVDLFSFLRNKLTDVPASSEGELNVSENDQLIKKTAPGDASCPASTAIIDGIYAFLLNFVESMSGAAV
jgi:hypothetical protein